MAGNTIAVLVNGAQGRMGRQVVVAVEAESDLALVGKTDLGDNLAKAIKETGAQVVVDFTIPDSAVTNTECILEAGAHPVVGTTGFKSEDIDRLTALAANLERGGLIAPNFAIGAVLLMRFAAEAARYMPHVEVIELHHDKKLDAPSGTAIKTIDLIAETLPKPPQPSPDEKELVTGARGGRYRGIAVHSVRLPGFVAHEEVIFGGLGQTLSIRHDSLSRESFMPGVVLAIRKVTTMEHLAYGLERIL
ncbi:MAG: 4-hydroxy-tetrahydrodipicolinate reductase [Planctomycetaceae bacterium]|nr:4-hydroxy-tetrahydrodipicolinate reductase [Planctomycetaceae bacterium]